MTTLAPPSTPTVTIHPATAADILDAAADYLAQHGLVRHVWCDDDDRVCLIGAINRVTGEPATKHRDFSDAASRALVDLAFYLVPDHVASNTNEAVIQTVGWMTHTQLDDDRVIAAVRAIARQSRREDTA